METLITSGVKISVTTQFRQDFSSLSDRVFFFNYRIDIHNANEFNVQLISREWYIFDSLNDAQIVNGDGVIGEQPILIPDDNYTYTSGCELRSELGIMKGFYTFKNLSTDELFQVIVPTFKLEFPGKLN
ncbi:MAG: Co2+/Mg2+ efflux protein ApaG [Fluviicola sp.]|nr:Co2+/Mg2+ efflux protein ApaG [Fluviicola sp.]